VFKKTCLSLQSSEVIALILELWQLKFQGIKPLVQSHAPGKDESLLDSIQFSGTEV
jgi:hypothetical protein